jgi:Mg2+/Co2+ transporter CorB
MSGPWPTIGLTLLTVVLVTVALGRPILELLGFRLIRRRKRGTKPGAPTAATTVMQPHETEGHDMPTPPRTGLEVLAELEVSDVMVHRMAMRSINVDDPAEAIVKQMLASPHTRMPLWQGSLDNIVGVLHAKDLLRELSEAGNDYTKLDIMKLAMKPWFVPDTTTLQDQLSAFLRRKSHFAIVVDEYGEVEGLLTLEDILEEIVGNIADEHDVEVQGVRQEADGSVVVDGSVPIRDLNRALGWSLPDEEATTIAGLVIHEAQSIPKERQAFTFHGKRFVVMKRDKNRITRLRVKPIGEKTSAASN